MTHFPKDKRQALTDDINTVSGGGFQFGVGGQEANEGNVAYKKPPPLSEIREGCVLVYRDPVTQADGTIRDFKIIDRAKYDANPKAYRLYYEEDQNTDTEE